MAADLRGTARTLCMGFFYKGSQMALPWAHPSAMDKHPPISSSVWESSSPSGLDDGHLLSSAGRITCTPSSSPRAAWGQALAMGRCPHMERGGSSRSSASCTSPSDQPAATPLQSHWVCLNDIPEVRCSKEGSKSRVLAVTSTFVPAGCRACNCSWKYPEKVFCPAMSATSVAICSLKASASCLVLLQNVPIKTHGPACHLTRLTLSEIREWFSDRWCRLGQILPVLIHC